MLAYAISPICPQIEGENQMHLDALKIGKSNEMRGLDLNRLRIRHVSHLNGPLKMEFDCTIECEYVRTVNIRIFCYL